MQTEWSERFAVHVLWNESQKNNSVALSNRRPTLSSLTGQSCAQRSPDFGAGSANENPRDADNALRVPFQFSAKKKKKDHQE